jgi:hypothetical protein
VHTGDDDMKVFEKSLSGAEVVTQGDETKKFLKIIKGRENIEEDNS